MFLISTDFNLLQLNWFQLDLCSSTWGQRGVQWQTYQGGHSLDWQTQPPALRSQEPSWVAWKELFRSCGSCNVLDMFFQSDWQRILKNLQYINLFSDFGLPILKFRYFENACWFHFSFPLSLFVLRMVILEVFLLIATEVLGRSQCQFLVLQPVPQRLLPIRVLSRSAPVFQGPAVWR